ncbi:MAG: methyltransferase, partial [Candidatus Tectomicrobia bacterium]
AGDFFQSVPDGGDAYILKHVLHDWDDDRCVSILGNCRRAISNQARLMVIEILVTPGNEPDYGKYLDLNMLVLTKGRERTEAQYRTLFEAAGFTLSRVVATRSELSIIEGRPA